MASLLRFVEPEQLNGDKEDVASSKNNLGSRVGPSPWIKERYFWRSAKTNGKVSDDSSCTSPSNRPIIKKTNMYSSTVTQFEEPPKKKLEESTLGDEPTALPQVKPIEQPLIYLNIFGIALLHVLAVYGFYSSWREVKFWTWVFSPIWGITAGIGITAGMHRLWAHRSYSAKTPLRVLLAILYCMAGQTHMYKWLRDHRTHHKFTDTAADPHDANRGFFFSHCGWLMMKRHPAVIEYGKKVDMSDIAADPVIQFFDKYYEFIMISLCFVIPTLIPVYCWNESWYIASHAVIIRYVWLLNATFAVNSFAHMIGNKPYNKNFKSTENGWVSFFALGEGWHNYHHAFPWDYKAAELGAWGLNPSTAFIEIMAKLGLAYDLKTPSKELVEAVSVKKATVPVVSGATIIITIITDFTYFASNFWLVATL